MVAGTLYTYPDNFRAQKALIAAKYSGAQLSLAKDFKFGETNKSPEFLKKFPLGKVPAFEGSDGVLLTESNAIAYYVANDELRGGSDAAARAQVVQWMAMADNEILPAACTWVFPTMGIMQFNKNATERAKEDVKAALKSLNDHENYSIWRGDYKYNDELTMIFMSCNLIGGMFQRLDKLNKNAFASVCLFGENNDSTISGIWVFKGHELAFELDDNWKVDYSSYSWKKMDSKSEDCKKLVDQYWKWEGADEKGRAFNQGKIFK